MSAKPKVPACSFSSASRPAIRAAACSRNPAFNVGTGIETDVVTLFRHLNALTGGRAEESHGPAKPGEQRRSVLDVSHSRAVLGWAPTVALEDGLAETVAFFREKVNR